MDTERPGAMPISFLGSEGTWGFLLLASPKMHPERALPPICPKESPTLTYSNPSSDTAREWDIGCGSQPANGVPTKTLWGLAFELGNTKP